MGVTARALRVRRGTFELALRAFGADARGTAVLGPNGAGKTTLLLALQRLIACDGDVERPARAAGVFARPAVLRGSALWNVAMAASAVRGLPANEAEARARRVLASVGLEERASADARSLSTGERQRLALARALAVEPQALFLDEPFANVDADARPQLRALVRDYAARTGCALVMATSSLADARALCARALVLRGGHVTYDGPVDGLATVEDAFVRALVADASTSSA